MMTDILDRILESFNEDERAMILSAYKEAERSLESRARGFGHPFIEHPLGVASIIANELGLPAESVAAVFLHEANRFQGDSASAINNSAMLEKFRNEYPHEVIDEVVSLNNISFITLQQTNLDEERYRKLIISYSTDPKVVLIKLADRLEILRNLELLPASKHKPKIMETALLYIPLAHQLGLYRIKSEMEDIFLKYSEPEQYRSITNNLKATGEDREMIVSTFINPLKEKLSRSGIEYTLKARTKSAYSIWRKMQAQKVPFEKVYDVFAIRFIIHCPPDREVEHSLCWKVYSLVTEEYQPDTSRMRDWLTVPKKNGYESLHTTVAVRKGVNVEVQIRTERMDVVAEQGHASHWSYKGIKSERSLSDWLTEVRTMLQSTASERYRNLTANELDEIFVFTPTGDLRQLKQGATVLDFAFDIHTNLGVKCTGGRVNGKMVPIKEKLKTGDVVDIVSSKNQKPTADWLNIAVTSKARSKIKQKLKEEENKMAASGREMMERRLKNWKLELSDEQFRLLVKKSKYRTSNEFLAAIGEGDFDVMEIKEFLTNESREGADVDEDKIRRSPLSGEGSSDYLVIDGKLDNVDYKMAKCCNPIFGDDVFGFVTIKEGIKIHRMSCPNASRLLQYYPYRIQKVKWREDVLKGSFQVNLKIITDGDADASNMVISTVNQFKTSIRSFMVHERSKGEMEIDMLIYVPGNMELDKIMASLKKQRDVKQVTRL